MTIVGTASFLCPYGLNVWAAHTAQIAPNVECKMSCFLLLNVITNCIYLSSMQKNDYRL